MSENTELSEAKRRLVDRLLNGQGASGRRTAGPVEPRPPGMVLPLSAEQHDVWLHAAMAPAVPLYNEAFTIHRRGPFDLGLFERSLNEIVRRLEVWRTSFEMHDGKLCQVVHPELRLKVGFVDLTGRPAAEREAAALRLAETEARQPFDLARLPLLRATAVRLAEDVHRIYVSLHHIIFDGVSIYRVVLPELIAIYQAFAAGRRPAVPEPALHYGDYAVWRERQLAGVPMAREVAYWRRHLAGELPVLRLPVTRPPPPAPSYRGAMETFALPDDITAALKALSRREGVTLYVVLLAAFKALLHRYSGQDDIIVGGVTDMRRRPELECVVGYFLNSMPLRTRPAAELPFRDYVSQVSDAVIGALDASTVPFNRMVRELQPRRGGGRHPLFDVLFSIQPPAPILPEGWDLTQMDVEVGHAKFDLYLELEERFDGGIVGRFLYTTDLFDPPAIRRMIGHWTTLLAAAGRDPACALGRLPLLTPAEAQAVLVDWNATAHSYPSSLTVPAWFEAQARRTPDAIAVECRGCRWRYRDLDRRAAQLTARLRAAGAGRGSLVAVAVERSFDMLAALLAVLKAGAAYLPLDGHLPGARLALLLDEARPTILLTETALAGRLPRSTIPLILCDETPVDGAAHDVEPAAAGPDDLAYVIYTSGSTGKPKGVEVRHRSVVNLLAAAQRELEFSARDSLLAVTTISFDIAALELYMPLVSGGRVVLADRDEAADPFRLADLFRRSGPAVMQATPATWRGLLAAGWAGDPHLKILCGGEALPADLAAQLLARSAALWNMYGPTETTIWSLMHKVRAGEDPVPIGRPIANTKVFVLDARGAPVPVGVPGELFIGGDGVARGYRHDPTQTAQRFAALPAVPEARLYKTGDVVRYRADGVLEFLGRTDNQVKVRGFRVGLEEVDGAIAAHPEVAAAAVRAVPDVSGEMTLVGFVVSKTAPGADIPGLQQFLQRILPPYMVPSRFVAMTALPMTANGKVDRKRLPAVPPAPAADAAAPADEFERILVRVWKELLGVASVRVHDNFFDLGGHSLLAFMLVAEIKRLTGRDLPLATLFQASTIAALADLLRSGREPEFSYLVPLQPGGGGRPFFIVHGVFGNVVQMKGLAERLRTDRPIYAIQARGVDPRQEPHTTIVDMAEAYIAAIRTRQPAGPYAIGGYSFGGLVAYEMARRLRAHGEEVDLLALIDVDLHERNLSMLDWVAYEWSLVQRVIAKLGILPARQWPGYLLSKLEMIWNGVLLRMGLREQGDPSNEITGALSPRAVIMYQIGYREFTRFRPQPFDRKVSVFRVSGPRFDACDSLPILRRLTPALDVYSIAGAHETVMDDEHSVGTLAVQLNRCLAAVDAGTEAAVPRAPRTEAGGRPHGRGLEDMIGLNGARHLAEQGH